MFFVGMGLGFPIESGPGTSKPWRNVGGETLRLGL